MVVGFPDPLPPCVISVNAYGGILLPDDAYAALGRPPFVRIAYAQNGRAFALQAAKKRTPNTRRACQPNKRSTMRIWHAGIPKHFGITASVRLSWEHKDGMLVVRVPE